MFRPRRASAATRPPTTSSHMEGLDDPFAEALRPPPGETEEERLIRMREIQAAQKISRDIDAQILESKKAFDKKKRAIKILLLGQAESGKSSLLKNFQLLLNPRQFEKERSIWKVVIQLNLIASVKRLLEILEEDWTHAPARQRQRPQTPLTSKHRRVLLSLSPLFAIATGINEKLNPNGTLPENLLKEPVVRAGSAWKTILSMSMSRKTILEGPGTDRKRVDQDEATSVLAACRDDIITLWEDPQVQEVLRATNVRFEESSGFFLNDTARIATFDYEPEPSDIVRARLCTMGVEEHLFSVEGVYPEWYIYDIGGSRTQRVTWPPYFEDVQAILFLAPLSFHRVLEEDPKVNRMEDSLLLWKEVCTNKLLSHTTLVLFLNKIDILERNLDSGMEVKRYVPSYDGPNDRPSVVKFFKDKFKAYYKRLRSTDLPFLCYETSAIDTLTTAVSIAHVKDSILQNALKEVVIL